MKPRSPFSRLNTSQYQQESGESLMNVVPQPDGNSTQAFSSRVCSAPLRRNGLIQLSNGLIAQVLRCLHRAAARRYRPHGHEVLRRVLRDGTGQFRCPLCFSCPHHSFDLHPLTGGRLSLCISPIPGMSSPDHRGTLLLDQQGRHGSTTQPGTQGRTTRACEADVCPIQAAPPLPENQG